MHTITGTVGMPKDYTYNNNKDEHVKIALPVGYRSRSNPCSWQAAILSSHRVGQLPASAAPVMLVWLGCFSRYVGPFKRFGGEEHRNSVGPDAGRRSTNS